MKITKYLPGILPLVLAVSVPVYANTIETFHVEASSVGNGISLVDGSTLSIADGAQTISGDWTYDATTGQLISETITQTDNATPGIFYYDTSSFPYTYFDQNAINLVLTIANFYDNTGDVWPGFSLAADWVTPITVGVNNLLTSSSWSLDYNGYQYTMAGAIVETSSVTTAVPEPAIIALLAAGLFGMGFTSRKNRLAA